VPTGRVERVAPALTVLEHGGIGRGGAAARRADGEKEGRGEGGAAEGDGRRFVVRGDGKEVDLEQMIVFWAVSEIR